MCADSLAKINVSSPRNTSTDKLKYFINPSYAANALSLFCRFYDEGKFTDFELSSGDQRK